MKIIGITGIRSEYDILFPVLCKLKDKGHQVKLIISGAHLSDWHGDSLENLINDRFEIADKVDSLYSTNRRTQRAKGVASLITGIAQCVEREKPDLMLYVGDREEGIAAAIVGNYMDVIFAHLSAGDPVWGNADDPIRFAITKLAHVHFAFAEEYAKNLLKIGEESFRVFNSGNPSLDNINNTENMQLEELSKYFNCQLLKQKYLVLIKHPLSSELESAEKQMRTTLESLRTFCNKYNMKLIGIYPNTDPGSYDIINVINEFENEENFFFHKNIPHLEFVNLMRNAACLVGNSSMGILEAPHYKLPVVNVGNRQTGRLNAGNVKFVDYNKEDIIENLEMACFNKDYIKFVKNLTNPYGSGNSSKKIIDALENINLSDRKWLIKKKLC